MAPSVTPPSANRPIARIARWAGLVLQLIIGIFPLSASGLMAPPWALVVVLVAWVVGLRVAWHLGRSRPALTLLVPFVTLAAWYLFMTAGALWLGWTA